MKRGAETVVRVEGLGKQYKLGVISTGTLVRDIQSLWCRFTGREDPNSLLVTSDDDTSTDHVWALRGVKFDIQQGEIVGVIGHNGAGKSTLLKMLTKLTRPTEGTIRMKGRVASLLEVGTGFHPELSGRENIFLNGAILGMSRSEIHNCFDEIVKFAEVKKFIDTPVKRYSSGMYVRLAFAVAAHLTPEILLVDEVLAVGDADFQRKCLGKMNDISRDGRTILFVSHNMAAIRDLCARAIVLEKGHLVFDGPADEAVRHYLKKKSSGEGMLNEEDLSKAEEKHNPSKTTWFSCQQLALLGDDGLARTSFSSNEPITIRIRYTCHRRVPKFNIILTITDQDNRPILRTELLDHPGKGDLDPGKHEAICTLPPNQFGEQRFLVNINLQYHAKLHLAYKGLLQFDVAFTGYTHKTSSHHSGVGAPLRPLLEWQKGCAGD